MPVNAKGMQLKGQSLSSLVTDSAIYGVGQIVTKGFRFLLLPILTAYWSVDEFGLYDICTFFITFLIPFNMAGMNSAINYFYGSAKSDAERTQVVSTAAFVILLATILLITVLFPLANPIRLLLNIPFENGRIIILAIFAATCTTWNDFTRVLFKWRFMPFNFLISSISTAFLLLLSAILALSRFGGGVSTLILCIIGANGAVAVANFFIQRTKFFAFSFSLRMAKEMLYFGYPQILVSIGSMLLPFLSRPILGGYYDLSTLGIYALAIRLSNLVQFVYAGFLTAWGPFAYTQYDQKEAPAKFARVTTLILSFLCGCALFISLFSSEIIALTTRNEDYIGAAQLLSALAFSPIFGCLVWIVSTGYNIAKKTYHGIWIYASSVAIALTLNLILIPRYSCWGAVIATMISQLYHVLISGFISSKYYRIPYDWKSIGIVIFSVTFLSLAGLFFNFYLSNIFLGVASRLTLIFLYFFTLHESGIIRIQKVQQVAISFYYRMKNRI